MAATWLVIFQVVGGLHRAFWGAGVQLIHVDVFLASSDMLAGIIWILIALYANRNYVMWIAGMQLLAILAHVARGLAEAISPIGYVVMVVAPGWIQLFSLGAGLILHIRRKRRYGPYRDWRTVRSRRELQILGGAAKGLRTVFPAYRRASGEGR